jgi:V/A-type H+-transporting ATPase subunit C
MAPYGPTSYANAHSRVRILYSELLSPQDYQNLMEAGDFDALITQMKETAYGPYLSRVEDRDLTPRRAVYQLRLRVVDAYLNAIHAAPQDSRPLLEFLFRHFELDNLKAILRGIITGSSWEQVKYVLFPLGPATVLPGETMVEAGNVGAAIEQIKETSYYEVLSHALQRYSAEQSLFPLEVALDLYYWRKLWESIHRLTGQDRTSAVQILGPLVDVTNLMWALRYRLYHHLAEEEIINYTLPFGYRLQDADVRAIAAGSDVGNIIERLYPELNNVNALLSQPERGLSLLETELQRFVAGKCRAAFAGYPFQIGLELAVLLLIEMEMQDLTVLIEAKAASMPAEEYEPFLINAPAAGVQERLPATA